MGKYLDQLRRNSQDTRVGSLTKLTEGASVGFVSAWGVGSPAEKTSGSAIQAAIVGARSWQDLSRLCEDIDAAYRAGNIDAEAADELTNLVRQRFREVPENDAALLEMPLSQFAQSGICREVHSKILDEQVLRIRRNQRGRRCIQPALRAARYARHYPEAARGSPPLPPTADAIGQSAIRSAFSPRHPHRHGRLRQSCPSHGPPCSTAT